MKKLEQYIELINNAETPEKAFERFCSIMQGYGYDRITYSLVTDHPSLGLPKQHGLATSYPEDWMKHYNDKNYMGVDPVVKQVMTSRKPFFWDDLIKGPDIAKPATVFMHEASDAGVGDGIGIPLCGISGEIVGIGLARSSVPSSPERNFEFLAEAYLLSVYFHETFRDMLSEPYKVNLTGREHEVLSWAAEGKTDEEISMLLCISSHTVRFHWKNIFKKLQANGRIYAVTKAIRLQLIVPHTIRSSY